MQKVTHKIAFIKKSTENMHFEDCLKSSKLDRI